MAPDLDFEVEGSQALRFAASPHIVFRLRITNRSAVAIHSVMLKCQAHIDASRRQYSEREKQRLKDLFGEPARWGQTLRGLFWTTVNTIVPSFDESVVVDLQVPCTFDFNVVVTKYFAGLDNGDIPLSFFFNGTIFYADDGPLQVSQISWEKEASFRLPVRTWSEMMDAYYPNSAWLCLDRQAFDRLYAYKVKHGIPTFEQALTQALGTIADEQASGR
jgi:hypothetical protein